MQIKVGKVVLGGEYIPVQTMLKNPVSEIEKTLSKLETLHKAGCDIIRITVPDEASVAGLKEVLRYTPIPIVADIHFDYRLAIAAIEAGVHKVRINPGNIGDKSKVKLIVDCLKTYKIPARIGINKGSLPAHLVEKYPGDPVKVMLESAREEVGYFLDEDYRNIVLSFKSSNVLETIEVNRRASKEFDIPLHIGVTEAGDITDGTIKNSIGVSILLNEGIGDTIRISLTAPEYEEINVGLKILEALGKRLPMLEIVSCPTCGRTDVDIIGLVEKFKKFASGKKFNKRLKVAIMGCIVNGPGEAKDADFGVAGGKNNSIIFAKGNKIKTVNNDNIINELNGMLKSYYEE